MKLRSFCRSLSTFGCASIASLVLLATFAQSTFAQTDPARVYFYDFSSAISGDKATSYTLHTTSWGLGIYKIVTKPSDIVSALRDFFDKTLGTNSGKMGVFSGANPNTVAALTISLQGLMPSKQYVLKYWARNAHDTLTTSPPNLRVTVDAQAAVTTGNLTVNSWNQFPVTFTSDATGSATIRFTDSQTADTRNDFALDDIEVFADINHASLVFFDAASPAPIEETASSATKIATVRRLSDSRIGQSQRVYLAQDGSAAEYGDDYTSAELKFDSAKNVLYVDIPVNQTSIDINILPTTDWRAESDELLRLRLLQPTDSGWTQVSPDYYAMDHNQATLTVKDVSVKAWITATTPTADERVPGTAAVVRFERDHIEAPATVYFRSRIGSRAAPELDFTVTGATWNAANEYYSVDFGSSTTADVNLNPVEDGFGEEDENVTFQIISAEGTGGGGPEIHYIVGSPSEAQVTIIDNSPEIELIQVTGSESTAEGSAPLTIATVRRAEGSDPAEKVRVYLVDDGSSADFNTDYTCAQLKYVSLYGYYYAEIPAGAMQVDLVIQATADGQAESSETVNLRLVDPSEPLWLNLDPPPKYHPGARRQASTVIKDVSSSVAVTAVTSSGIEGQTPKLKVRFERSRSELGRIVYFDLAAESTATVNTDFTFSAASYDSSVGLYFIDFGSDLVKEIEVTANADAVAEPDESVAIHLVGLGDSRLSGKTIDYQIGWPAEVSLTIQDTQPGVRLTVIQGQMPENDQVYEAIAVKLNRPAPSAFTVGITQNSAEAKDIYDYLLTGSRTANGQRDDANLLVDIPAGADQVIIKVQPIRDGTSEPTERAEFKLKSSSTYYTDTTPVSVLIRDTTQQFNITASNAVKFIDFEEDTLEGATSEYGRQNDLYPEGYYQIGSRPRNFHNDFATIYDHTEGTSNGRMMVINGHWNAGVKVLAFTVNGLGANNPFYFSYWGASVHPTNPALMQMIVNGVYVGQAHFQTDFVWRQYTYVFTADANGSARIEFLNLNTIRAGNDFALDDIGVGVDTTKIAELHLEPVDTASSLEETATDSTTIFRITRELSSSDTAPQKIYLVQTVTQAQLGVDFTSDQIKKDGNGNLYVELVPGQRQLDVTIKPTTDWLPEGDEQVGFRLMDFYDSAWSALNPNYYPFDSPEKRVAIKDVNVDVQLAAAAGHLFEDPQSAVQTFQFSRDETAPQTTIYFDLLATSTATIVDDYTLTGAVLAGSNVPGLYKLTFATGEVAKYLTIEAKKDSFVEADEDIRIRLVDKNDPRLASTDIRYVAATSTEVRAVIHDRSAQMNIRVLEPNLTENGGTKNALQFYADQLVVSGTSRVYFVIDNSNSTATDEDFTASGLTYDSASGFFYVDINWAQTQTATVAITPIDDWQLENGETIIWKLVTAAEADARDVTLGYKLGSAKSGTVNIVDSSPEVSFVVADNLYRETDAEGDVFHLQRTRKEQPMRVYFKQGQQEGRAERAIDFTLSGTGLAFDDANDLWYIDFLAGVDKITFRLKPHADYLAEGTETSTFILLSQADLTAIDPALKYRPGSPSGYEVAIDDSNADVSVQLATSSVHEWNTGGVVGLTVRRVSDSTADWQDEIRVYFRLTGAASVGTNEDYRIDAGSDATFGLYYVAVPAGEREKSFRIFVNDDWKPESDEMISFSMITTSEARSMQSSVGSGIRIVSFAKSDVGFDTRIIDSTPTIKLELAQLQIWETENPKHVLTATRTRNVNGTEEAVSGKASLVYVKRSGGTAAFPDDYSLNGMSRAPDLSSDWFVITIDAASNWANVTFDPVDDFDEQGAEQNETIVWQLATAGKVDGISGSARNYNPSGASVEFTIRDVDPQQITLLAENGNATEAAGTPKNFTVRREEDATGLYPPFSVTLKLAGTAMFNADYLVFRDPTGVNQRITSSSFELWFPEGENEMILQVAPSQDLIQEDTLIWGTTSRQHEYVDLGDDPNVESRGVTVSNTARIYIEDDEPVREPVTIRGVIVSGKTGDPWKAIEPGQVPKVDVQGGIIALDDDPNPSVNSSNAVELRPNAGLMSGAVVPPIMPTVIDTRITETRSATGQ